MTEPRSFHQQRDHIHRASAKRRPFALGWLTWQRSLALVLAVVFGWYSRGWSRPPIWSVTFNLNRDQRVNQAHCQLVDLSEVRDEFSIVITPEYAKGTDSRSELVRYRLSTRKELLRAPLEPNLFYRHGKVVGDLIALRFSELEEPFHHGYSFWNRMTGKKVGRSFATRKGGGSEPVTISSKMKMVGMWDLNFHTFTVYDRVTGQPRFSLDHQIPWGGDNGKRAIWSPDETFLLIVTQGKRPGRLVQAYDGRTGKPIGNPAQLEFPAKDEMDIPPCLCEIWENDHQFRIVSNVGRVLVPDVSVKFYISWPIELSRLSLDLTQGMHAEKISGVQGNNIHPATTTIEVRQQLPDGRLLRWRSALYPSGLLVDVADWMGSFHVAKGLSMWLFFTANLDVLEVFAHPDDREPIAKASFLGSYAGDDLALKWSEHHRYVGGIKRSGDSAISLVIHDLTPLMPNWLFQILTTLAGFAALLLLGMCRRRVTGLLRRRSQSTT